MTDQTTLAPLSASWRDWVNTSPHRSAFVDADGVLINYLDWGGDKPPLVMVHGIANSPHSFDDLAPLLSDRFRVIAYARRGHGLSDAPNGPYDAETLVSDLTALVDELGLEKASFLGWSMGGDEITEFAGRYPDRVDKLVYLEGAYDWSDPMFFDAFVGVLAANSPKPDTLSSLDNLRTWYHEAWVGQGVAWSSALEAFLRDAVRFASNGSVDPVPSIEVFEALVRTLGSWPRDYRKITAPSLALYASAFFPTDRDDPVLVEKLCAFERNTMDTFRRASMVRLRLELANVEIQQIPGTTHMSIGVQDLEALAGTIRAFLTKP